MKTTLSILALLAASLCSPAHALDNGQKAPEISVNSPQGNVRLAALKGSVVYLDFWASWCGPCKQSFPWLNEMQAKYGAKGLRIVAVNVDQRREDAERFLAQVPARFQIAYDSSGDTPRAYGVKAMPSSVLIDADGRVLAQHSGFRGNDGTELETRIAAALAARP